MTGDKDLMAATAWAAATLAAVLWTDSVLLRILMGAPLVLFLTGHAVLRATGSLAETLAEHVVYAVGTSIAVCLAGGLVLNRVGSLMPTGWAVWFLGVIVVSTLVARRRGPSAWPLLSTLRPPQLARWQMSVLVLAALVATAAYGLAVSDAARHKEFAYTEFWMLPGGAAAPRALLVGIKSAEPAPLLFDVEVTLDGQMVALWRSVTIAPGQLWTRDIDVTLDKPGPHKANALLYRHEDNTIYRKVSAVVPAA